jgi:hypothetical protein
MASEVKCVTSTTAYQGKKNTLILVCTTDRRTFHINTVLALTRGCSVELVSECACLKGPAGLRGLDRGTVDMANAVSLYHCACVQWVHVHQSECVCVCCLRVRMKPHRQPHTITCCSCRPL